MSFPPQFLDELRGRLPLSEVAGRRIRLMRAGREFKALCPFHKEKSPSFTLNDHKGFFHCFGCGAHGDVIGFVMRHDNLDFLEAIEQLASLAGLAVPRAEAPERARYQKEKRLYETIEAAARWFELQLWNPRGDDALAYLRGRGLDEPTIRMFRLGYAPPEGAALRTHLAQAGFTDDEQLEAGLTRRPEDGRPPYSFFRHRVLFPVADRRGRVVAFGGRLLAGDGPKYINTGETTLFHKGELLYGISRARQAASEGHPVVVVEGYMDVVSMVRAGYPGAVAPLGTALTESQVHALWKLFPGRDRVPVLCFDGDSAGRKAARRAIERVLPLLAPDQTVRIAFLPEGEDPDSLIRRAGAPAIAECLGRSLPLVDVLWQIELEDRRLDSPEARAGLKAALLERITAIPDRTVQVLYRQDILQRCDALFFPNARARGNGGGNGNGAGADGGTAPGWTGGYGGRNAGQGGGRYAGPGGGRYAGGGSGGGLAAPGGRRGFGAPSAITLAREGARAAMAAAKRRRPAGQEGLRDRVLLAALLYHPWLIEEVVEELAHTGFAERRWDAVRAVMLAAAPDQPAPDTAALALRLTEAGLDAERAALMAPDIARLARFVRADAPAETVRPAVATLLAQPVAQRLAEEQGRLVETCRESVTAENLDRLLAVTREIRDWRGATSDELEPDTPKRRI